MGLININKCSSRIIPLDYSSSFSWLFQSPLVMKATTLLQGLTVEVTSATSAPMGPSHAQTLPQSLHILMRLMELTLPPRQFVRPTSTERVSMDAPGNARKDAVTVLLKTTSAPNVTLDMSGMQTTLACPLLSVCWEQPSSSWWLAWLPSSLLSWKSTPPWNDPFNIPQNFKYLIFIARTIKLGFYFRVRAFPLLVVGLKKLKNLAVKQPKDGLWGMIPTWSKLVIFLLPCS